MNKIIKITRGKITIPKELIEKLSLEKEDSLIIEDIDEKIVLRKIRNKCCLCNEEESAELKLLKFEKNYICEQCLEKIKGGD